MAKKHSNSYKPQESTQGTPEQHAGKTKTIVNDTKNNVKLTIQDEEPSQGKQTSAPLTTPEQEDTAKLIAAHKAALATENQSEKTTVSQAAPAKETKKKGKIDRNPLNWVRHIGTRALSGIGGFPSRVAAKLNHIVARPQQLVSGKFYKDL